ncbi:MAG: hypothetical protein ACK5JT_20075 [Hyphomicrobiaceae bacterium]
MGVRSMISAVWRNRELREQCLVFASQFTLNLSLVVILLVASLVLVPAEFARLSLVNGYIMIGAMLLDVGLNGASLKLSVETGQRAFVLLNQAVKAAVFVVSLLLLVVAGALGHGSAEVIVVACAAGLAFWYATRTVEQFDRLFVRYAKINLALGASRLLVGGTLIASRSWWMIAAGVHVVALLPICAKTLVVLMRDRREVWRACHGGGARVLLRLAPAFFFCAAFYSAIPVITQTAIAQTGDAMATGAFGIVLLVVGPVTLLTSTLRIYLQPQIIATSIQDVDVFGLGAGSLHLMVVVYASMLLLGIVPASMLVEWAYHLRYPGVGTMVLIYGGATCIVEAIGFYNVRVMRRDFVRVGLWVNVLRAGACALPFLYHLSPLHIATWSAVVLVVGELALLWLLTAVDNNTRHYADG